MARNKVKGKAKVKVNGKVKVKVKVKAKAKAKAKGLPVFQKQSGTIEVQDLYLDGRRPVPEQGQARAARVAVQVHQHVHAGLV